MTKCAFRRLSIQSLQFITSAKIDQHFTSPRTSAFHQMFWPIKCSLESKAPTPFTINTRRSTGWDQSLVHSICIFCTVNGTQCNIIGDRERFRQWKYALHWGKRSLVLRYVTLTDAPWCTHSLHRSRDTIALSGSHARVAADHNTYRTHAIYSNMAEIVAVIPCQMWLYRAQWL